MRRSFWYEQLDPAAPPPLVHSVERVCRFEEVDPLNVMWHGRYPSYLEDSRVALGEGLGIGYMDFYRAGVAVPIKQLHIEYRAPVHFGQNVRIEASLQYCEAARMNISYRILDAADGEVLTEAFSVQLFCLIPSGELCLAPPDFYVELLERWKAGHLR